MRNFAARLKPLIAVKCWCIGGADILEHPEPASKATDDQILQAVTVPVMEDGGCVAFFFLLEPPALWASVFGTSIKRLAAVFHLYDFHRPVGHFLRRCCRGGRHGNGTKACGESSFQ
ncbi:hypothetical protein [Kordiimonas gwangyangensis]|uniref:hypothetical protein n=1 Tax=Kordiimonas gwangyangensis TaxID=288022 RepID=UPI00192E598A|nr:hypothetical protein [Kordiimonas gwangyangensis]